MSTEITDKEVKGLKALFDRWADEGLDQEMAAEHQRTANDALAGIPLSPDDRVLDIGTGNGFATRILASMEPDAHIYGLDLSPNMVQSARSHDDEIGNGYVVGDVHSIPIPDDTIQFAFMMDVIQYSPHPERALNEIQRVLGPDGQLFCANTFYEDVVEAQPELGSREGIQLCWNEQEFREAFRTCGFTSIQQSHIPDVEVTIPPSSTCKKMGWESRSRAKTVYKELGTLLTVGTAY